MGVAVGNMIEPFVNKEFHMGRSWFIWTRPQTVVYEKRPRALLECEERADFLCKSCYLRRRTVDHNKPVKKNLEGKGHLLD